jgi:hypothetical protein
VKQITFARCFFKERRERVFGDRVGTVTASGGGIGERQAMAQQTQQWRSGNGEKAWLSALIGTMDKVSRPQLRATPCAPSLLAAVETHLARPAAPHGLYGSAFSLRN